MLGKITTLASQCPSGSYAGILPRFFQRFGLFLAFHWDNIIQHQIEVAEVDCWIAESPGSHEAAWALKPPPPEVREKKEIREPTLSGGAL